MISVICRREPPSRSDQERFRTSDDKVLAAAVQPACLFSFVCDSESRQSPRHSTPLPEHRRKRKLDDDDKDPDASAVIEPNALQRQVHSLKPKKFHSSDELLERHDNSHMLDISIIEDSDDDVTLLCGPTLHEERSSKR